MPIEVRQIVTERPSRASLGSPAVWTECGKMQGSHESERIEDMKYILMMNTMRAGRDVPNWPKKDLQAHIAFMKSLTRNCGNLASWCPRKAYRSPIKPSSCGGQEWRCRSPTACFRKARNFSPASGSSMSDTPERAYALAARISAAPGPEGAPLNMPIEVRPVPSGPPPEML